MSGEVGRVADESGDVLTEAGCHRVFEDKISSRRANRAGLASALDYLRTGDTLCVWKLDRLGRSVGKAGVDDRR